jgi:hypothetical protein
VQFPTENGYRTAGIAIEKPSSYTNLNVTIPTVAPIVEGAIIQCVVLVCCPTVKAVQSVLELN